MKIRGLVWLVAAMMSFVAAQASAYEAGTWVVKAGFHSVQPKGNNAYITEVDANLDVDSAEQFTFDITYMLTERFGIEVLAAAPFEHDIDLGGGRVGSTKHLPPTVSAIYHFYPDAKVDFYVGLGVNATIFWDESTTGGLAGADLELDTSFGPAAMFAVDYHLNDKWMISADFRYMDIDTDAKVSLPGLTIKETVEIDPLAFGLRVGYQF